MTTNSRGEAKSVSAVSLPLAPKSRKLNELQRKHRELLSEIDPLRRERNRVDRKIRKMQTRLKSLGMAIYDMKHNGNTPEVTDHAIVRYLERIKGVDILELKLEVSEHKLAQKQGNVIVTVNEEYDTELNDLQPSDPEAKSRSSKAQSRAEKELGE